jgi:hypothetical protein
MYRRLDLSETAILRRRFAIRVSITSVSEVPTAKQEFGRDRSEVSLAFRRVAEVRQSISYDFIITIPLERD